MPRRPAVEQRVDDAGAARLGEEVRAEADQAARRHAELERARGREPAWSIFVIMPRAHAEELRDDADVVLGHVDDQQLDRLLSDAVDARA